VRLAYFTSKDHTYSTWRLPKTSENNCFAVKYGHQPLPVTENGEVRIAWDITIYTDKVLKHDWPDITVVHKDTQIDIAVPGDQNITRTEEGKVEKY